MGEETATYELITYALGMGLGLVEAYAKHHPDNPMTDCIEVMQTAIAETKRLSIKEKTNDRNNTKR